MLLDCHSRAYAREESFIGHGRIDGKKKEACPSPGQARWVGNRGAERRSIALVHGSGCGGPVHSDSRQRRLLPAGEGESANSVLEELSLIEQISVEMEFNRKFESE